MFVGGLPVESTEESVTELFAEFGRVRSIKLASDVFSGKCKGFGFVEMEGHEARKAIAALDGKVVGEKSLRVQFENPKGKGGKRRTSICNFDILQITDFSLPGDCPGIRILEPEDPADFVDK